MFVTMVLAALLVDGLFSAAGLIPDARPTRADIFSEIKVDYKLFTNILGVAIFAALFALTMRRGATDPVCGMKVDKAKAIRVEHGTGRPCTSAASTARTPSKARDTPTPSSRHERAEQIQVATERTSTHVRTSEGGVGGHAAEVG